MNDPMMLRSRTGNRAGSGIWSGRVYGNRSIRLSKGLKPEPLTVTKNAGPTEVGETETVDEKTVKLAVAVSPPPVPVAEIV